MVKSIAPNSPTAFSTIAAISAGNANVGGRTIAIGEQSVNVRGIGVIGSLGLRSPTFARRATEYHLAILASLLGMLVLASARDLILLFVAFEDKREIDGSDYDYNDLIFAFAPDPYIAITVNLLHGICYAFFFATVYIFVDTYFPKDTRASAQGLFNMMIFGFGNIAANLVCPWLKQSVYTTGELTDFRGLFLVPTLISVIAAVALAVLFRPPPAPAPASAAPPAH